ncbi:DUF6119 family protein [Kribbella sp. NPDC051620]|uniref:DUF6119 family protein n=1 Tax=Kribbella sp. NPDC051620 TaxID=3364120 RepID=UPI003799B281
MARSPVSVDAPLGEMESVAAKTGILAPIYKIDVDSALEILGEVGKEVDLPEAIVAHYNKIKDSPEGYKSQGSAVLGGAKFDLYLNAAARPNLSAWVKFFDGSGIELDDIYNSMQHLVCFVTIDDDLYAYTSGQALVVFERFIDISFPIEVGRRVAKPEVKGARSSQITGDALASNVHFRDPRRITYTESLVNVWTALSGQIRDEVLSDDELLSVFGKKTKIRLDVGASVKLGPRIESPEKILELIRWLAAKAVSPLPSDDGWGALDAIKILNPRKKKDLIAELRLVLAQRLFVDHDYVNLAISHVDASMYGNATEYIASQGRDIIYEDENPPSLEDIVDSMKIDGSDLIKNFNSVSIRTENSDYGLLNNTNGPLLSHLHGELRHEGKTYFLLSGKWYEVDAAYIEQVTKDFLAVMKDRDVDSVSLGLQEWNEADGEGLYNETAVVGRTFINGDKVLTDNVELFDGLASDGENTYIIHVKRNFDVKVRDVRSQVINSAQIIENDLRIGTRVELREHYGHLLGRGRLSLSEDEFLALFEQPRTYVVAYGSKIKVGEATLNHFKSSVARMEVVSLDNQFRQIGSGDSRAKLQITWVKIAETGFALPMGDPT